ncbi:MAG: Maf family protein [Armatimonadetes bacterium]|nr:Maf family protein [Armatimonadota bacterium]
MLPPLDIILASASPRRRELLSLIFEDFQVLPSEFEESEVPADLPPVRHVEYSATMKARDVAAKHPGSLVIGADTIVVVRDQILGKPADAADAGRMLRGLSGRTHEVYTGLAVILGDMERTGVECTDVTFRKLTDEMISRYISSGEPMDKAGAYAIQGRASVLIKSIRGCYFNVVGLPLYRLSTMLEEFGVAVIG